jgi:hypothetical protein
MRTATLAAFLIPAAAWAAAPDSTVVTVEVLHGLPDNRSWDLSKAAPDPSATFAEPAFALTGVPARYTEKGVLADRPPAFVVRASAEIALPAGEWQVLLRARDAARLFLDDKLIAEHAFGKVSTSGHGKVPPPAPLAHPELRPPSPGQKDKVVAVKLDGARHRYRLEVYVGGKGLRPELGDPAVAVAQAGEPFRLLAASPEIPLSPEGWAAYAAAGRARLAERNSATRKAAGAAEAEYWSRRHEIARREWAARPAPAVPEIPADLPAHNDVDRFLGRRFAEAGVRPAPLADDYSFLRRVTLDTVGVIPTPEEIAAFRADTSPDRRARVINRLLADPRWADHWVGYWQDVLAENPGLLKPTLNNTGPFRWWLHQALSDNMPADRFATELALMEGSADFGGPAGFGIATENDVPMAAKAHTLAKAFLAVDLSCARCHDAPFQPYKQRQLFALAAMLKRGEQKVPATSTVRSEGGRAPRVKVTLPAGSAVGPDWQLKRIAPGELPDGILRKTGDTRELAAALLTSPRNERFAQVLVNRLWKRFLGTGLVEPVDDWNDAQPSHPELLDHLAGELVTSGYDVKHVSRLILNSHAYQRAVIEMPAGKTADRLFASPDRRRMAAEQLLDSLFAAAGKDFGCEELNFDPDGRQPVTQCQNLGVPKRAWQLTGMANERDRPALALPVAQTLTDLLIAYGWRESRTVSQTVREETPTPLQPMVLANGIASTRIARLSDDGALTALALADVPVGELVDRVFLRILSRPPTDAERAAFTELLAEGYDTRRTGAAPAAKPARRSPVAWSNHLSPEATEIKLELEAAARAGDPPTPRLTAAWRARMEDMVWALVNSPEFVFVP